MTKPLVTLPCTAQELENALHAVCDHGGLWGAKVLCLNDYETGAYLELYDETETKGETREQ